MVLELFRRWDFVGHTFTGIHITVSPHAGIVVLWVGVGQAPISSLGISLPSVATPPPDHFKTGTHMSHTEASD